MRSVLVLFFALVVTAALPAAEVEFAHVGHGWRDAVEFERISEFFTGKENTSGQVILRSHPDVRGGYYFLARVKNAGGALSDAKFSLNVIAPHEPQPKKFVFPAALKPGTNLFNLGLTGADWTDKKNPPVAWKLELLRADGSVLASAQSYLWEKPAK
jgi:hypothetical protein